MNTQTQSRQQAVATIEPNKLSVTAKKIDEIAAGAMDLFKQAGSFEAELSVAASMQTLRAMLTPEVMAPVMALMNTAIGFQTDRNPNKKDKDGNYPTPYPVDVVREVFIESKLRGFHTVGNEFNIIAGNFYGAKNGFRRKVTNFPGLTELKDSYDIPRMNQTGDGSIQKCRATWKVNGKPDELEAEFAIRVNKFQGADAIQGKAERKLMKRIHDRLTGMNTPDGDLADEPYIDVETSRTNEPGPELFPKADPKSKAQSTPKTATSAGTTEASGKSSSTASSSSAPSAATKKGSTPQERLQKLVIENGYTWEDFKRWGVEAGEVDPDCQNFSQLPETETIVFIDRWEDILANLEKGGGK